MSWWYIRSERTRLVSISRLASLFSPFASYRYKKGQKPYIYYRIKLYELWSWLMQAMNLVFKLAWKAWKYRRIYTTRPNYFKLQHRIPNRRACLVDLFPWNKFSPSAAMVNTIRQRVNSCKKTLSLWWSFAQNYGNYYTVFLSFTIWKINQETSPNSIRSAAIINHNQYHRIALLSNSCRSCKLFHMDLQKLKRPQSDRIQPQHYTGTF